MLGWANSGCEQPTRRRGHAMSLLDAFTDLLRPRRPALVEGLAESKDAATFASVSTAPVADRIAVSDAPEASPPTSDEEDQEPSEREKSLMLHLSNVSHACNHFQNQMLT